MTIDEILKNYNKLGTEIIESIFTYNYLSIGGTESTEMLAGLANISANSRVLDVGSGVGGPSMHLAATYKCRVTGLDLVELNVRQANDRAKARSLTHLAKFKVGNALTMPFEDNSFDVVWGQDAWCHVPDKTKLFEEVTRVLTPVGKVAFTDWVQTCQMERSELSKLLSAMAAPNIATATDYRRFLELLDYTIIVQDDISDVFISQYRRIMAEFARTKQSFSERYSPKIYNIVMDRNQCILKGFESGALGGTRIVAQ